MINATTFMRAHQYLYYCCGMPVISDREYDLFCRENNLDGKGGSDLESDYTEEEKAFARSLLNPYLIQTR